MVFARLLEEKKSAILDRWFDLVLETYPADTQRFLKKQRSRFGNPVAHEISQGIEGIFDQLVKGGEDEAISPFLDRIVRIRAVQEFTPAQALGFIFGLKRVIREELAGSPSPAEPIECEARIDRLALLAGEREALSDLVRGHDPVPVAGHGAESVVHRRRRRAEVLDLLEHGIRDPALERVAREDEERKSVGHRSGSRRDHVRRSRADRGRDDHDLAASRRLREGDPRERHALLVLPPVQRQRVVRLVKSVPQPEDVPLPEDREHTREEGRLSAVDDRPLRDEEADDRLRRRESHGRPENGVKNLGADLLLVGSREPHVLDWGRLARAFADPGIGGDLRATAVFADPETLAATWTMGRPSLWRRIAPRTARFVVPERSA